MWALDWRLTLTEVLEMTWDEYLLWWNAAVPQLAQRFEAVEKAQAELKKLSAPETKAFDILELT